MDLDLARRLRKRVARVAFGLSSLLDHDEKVEEVPLLVEPGHFYSPIVNPKIAEKHLDMLEGRGLPLSLPGIAIDRKMMRVVWDAMVPHFASIPFSEEGSVEHRYKFANGNYSWGDGSVLHAMLRLHRPKRVIEVGSGWSSACMIDTAESQPESPCQFTFIEPYPELLESLLKTTSIHTNILRSPVQDVDLQSFDTLERNDFLFIDSTHVLKTGSDVAWELFEIMPRLKKGVVVHFHDIFWPFEYPRRWAVTNNNSWNEVYAVRAFLTENSSWEILFFNDFFRKTERSQILNDYPQFMRNSGGALWLRRV